MTQFLALGTEVSSTQGLFNSIPTWAPFRGEGVIGREELYLL